MQNKSYKELRVAQMSDTLQKGINTPIENIGWQIKSIRETLGMTQKQLARRIGVKQSVISRIEKKSENCSLKTIFKLLAALNCSFSGFIVSKEKLYDYIVKAAEKKASEILKRTLANMAMEKQAPYKAALSQQFEDFKKEIIIDPGPGLWEE
ncbi:MAG: hypothetical protein A2044_05470 [Candidatus Firestonebacteria bacterium GWA2_43_8]|nr:MAG: hypothetical protein A2044_05470 [Candidatus Firestonebacteria bacterium GWA2_43_8]